MDTHVNGKQHRSPSKGRLNTGESVAAILIPVAMRARVPTLANSAVMMTRFTTETDLKAVDNLVKVGADDDSKSNMNLGE
jgi:ABC-type arginine/histidine transport system permease subunit